MQILKSWWQCHYVLLQKFPKICAATNAILLFHFWPFVFSRITCCHMKEQAPKGRKHCPKNIAFVKFGREKTWTEMCTVKHLQRKAAFSCHWMIGSKFFAKPCVSIARSYCKETTQCVLRRDFILLYFNTMQHYLKVCRQYGINVSICNVIKERLRYAHLKCITAQIVFNVVGLVSYSRVA